MAWHTREEIEKKGPSLSEIPGALYGYIVKERSPESLERSLSEYHKSTWPIPPRRMGLSPSSELLNQTWPTIYRGFVSFPYPIRPGGLWGLSICPIYGTMRRGRSGPSEPDNCGFGEGRQVASNLTYVDSTFWVAYSSCASTQPIARPFRVGGV